MNLSQLRDLVLDLRAWTSSGTTFDARLNRAINLAYRKMSKDVPTVLVPSFETHYVFKDQTTTATNAKVRLKSGSDGWVLEFTDVSGNVFGAAPTVTWRPQVNGTWDGLMHIEATDAAGVVYRYQCREFWTEGAGASQTYLVTINRPFHDTSGSALHSFRIHQPTIWLKSDYIRVSEVSAWDSEYKDDRIEKIDLALVDRHKLRDFRGDSNGKPQAIFSNQHMQLPGPAGKPTFSESATPWVGTTVAAGEFTFKYTFAIGFESETEGSVRYSSGGYKEPILESPASPESDRLTLTAGALMNKISMAPIDHMMNFVGTGSVPPRSYRSGMRLRLYAARHETTQGSAVSPLAMQGWPADGKYYLISDVQTVIDPLTGGYAYTWQGSGDELGSGVPDMTKTLRENHIYRGWSLYPHQTKNFRLDFRVLRPPDALESDTDYPLVEPDAESALVELVLYYLCLMDGADQAGAQAHLANYGTEIKSVRNQHASPAGSVMPSTWDEAGIRVWNPGTYEDI